MTTVLAGAGLVAALGLGRAAWRAPARERARRARAREPRRLPARLRDPLARALAEAQWPIGPEDAVSGAGIAVLGVTFPVVVLAPALAPVVFVAAVAAGPVLLVTARARVRRRYLADLPGLVELLAARMRSGHTVVTALGDAAGASDLGSTDPVATDLRSLLARVDHGEPLTDALEWWARRRPLPPLRAVAGALAVAAVTGGAAAEALDGLARSLRDQLGAQAEALAQSAQARLSAIVVGAAPLGYLAFAALVDPGSVGLLLTTGVGRVCLVAGLALDAVAVVWMRRIVRSEP